MDEDKESVCELCEGTNQVAELEWNDDVKEWINAGTKPCPHLKEVDEN